jgi:hypothetical protein
MPDNFMIWLCLLFYGLLDYTHEYSFLGIEIFFFEKVYQST